MGALIVTYKTHPESADENERLVADVFAELNATCPAGIRYAAFRLDDCVSFVHVAMLDDDLPNPLAASAAFAAFQRDLAGRCAVAPLPVGARLVGSYGIAED
ncbi:MAG: hypothetical protein FJW96_11540 [Actinobacteria bacterium]|nr:hypothetical protein [Actinomycetota bacterium]